EEVAGLNGAVDEPGAVVDGHGVAQGHAEGAHLPGGHGPLLDEQVRQGAPGGADGQVGASVLGQPDAAAGGQVGVGGEAGELGGPFEEDFAAGAVDAFVRDGDAQEAGGLSGDGPAEDAAYRVAMQ